MRLSAYMQPSCPEFRLCDLPRITVRGQTVQGGGVLLRKAPLRSRVYPWSTKRHCGPLAFRRATEGSRVRRRVWGCQEGAREPYGALAPFCLRRRAAAIPSAVGTAFPLSALRRNILHCAAGFDMMKIPERGASYEMTALRYQLRGRGTVLPDLRRARRQQRPPQRDGKTPVSP